MRIRALRRELDEIQERLQIIYENECFKLKEEIFKCDFEIEELKRQILLDDKSHVSSFNPCLY